MLNVPSDTTSSGFDTRSSVGIKMVGLTIDHVVIGGPAYNCQRLSKGDILLKVDDEPVDVDTFRDKLIGCDVPGSWVKITAFSPTQNEEKEVVLTRMATTMIANNLRMVELFTSLKVCRQVICVCERPNAIHASINAYMYRKRMHKYVYAYIPSLGHISIDDFVHPSMHAQIDAYFICVCLWTVFRTTF